MDSVRVLWQMPKSLAHGADETESEFVCYDVRQNCTQSTTNMREENNYE